jgi:hypothetical protein
MVRALHRRGLGRASARDRTEAEILYLRNRVKGAASGATSAIPEGDRGALAQPDARRHLLVAFRVAEECGLRLAG